MRIVHGIVLSFFVLSTAGLAAAPAIAGGTLPAFESEAALQAQWAEWRAVLEREEERLRRARQLQAVPPPPPAPAAMASPAPTAAAPSIALDRVQVTGTAIGGAPESITNVQTEGVDEGDIVKAAGDFLIVLRRGRLFTIRVGGGDLVAVDAVDAFAPGSDPRGTWYDEMLVSAGTVVVVGYSYDRGGTEIGLFDLADDGTLAYRATYQLRSNDYYSARNYASRLVGRTLLFYSPTSVDFEAPAAAFLPALRRWHVASTPDDFRRILPARRIYRAPPTAQSELVDWLDDLTLHSVTRCTLGDGEMECEATAVLGPSGRVFYVSQSAVYVWTTPGWADEDRPNASTLYRLPLDGGAATALRASGGPIDQMSFLEADGMLNVLVGSESDGEGMWRSLGHAGELALLRVPVARLGDGSDAAAPGDYRPLPGDTSDGEMMNRFIGEWLVYGRGRCWRGCDQHTAYAVRHAGGGPVASIRVPHRVDRIDALGRDAILVGAAGPDLHFTSLRLSADIAHAASAYVMPGSRQGDERTHGFFYRPTGEGEGIVGLPTLGGDSAGVTYLRNHDLRLSGMGTLHATGQPSRDDGCVVSCVDWYGNARPIFLGERVFALLGYELVEGTVAGERIREARRVDFGPVAREGRVDGHVQAPAP
jgi:hypothetical protein